VIRRSKEAGLFAVAITDHDTLSGYVAAKAEAVGIELIAGVEITAEFENRELHLLGYFVCPDHSDLDRALASVRFHRSGRFEAMASCLRQAGLTIDDGALRTLLDSGATLGRRHLAQLLVGSKQAGSLFDAFSRYLNVPRIQQLPKYRLPVADAIELVKAAGGVTSWAHPPSDAGIEDLRLLQAIGLDAVESEYPWSRPSRGKKLRGMAAELGLDITGGSDCHGPQPNCRVIGAKGIRRNDLEKIRLCVCRR
jgi:3',5'-nucleoside bisphosphate phosphatase